MGEAVKNTSQLLVGSIPLRSALEVFTTAGDYFEDNLAFMPDGEFGDRIWWHNYLARYVYHGHPDIKTIKRPAPIDGFPNWKPRDLSDMWLFEVQDGITSIKLPELGYAKWAAASYETFSLLRNEGKIPKSRKFQVNLPLTSSAIATFFHRPADLSIMARAYEDAAHREVSAILETVPAKDLLILWDVCVEILDLEGALPWMPLEGAMQRNAEGASNIVAKIPTDVAVGYHLCYGTLPRWPMVELRNIGTQVALANALIEGSGRPIEVLHLVIPKSPTEAFFDGADKLQSRGADLYLGLLHEDDSIEDNLVRVRMARKFLPSFGTSYVCGFGRRSVEDTKRLLSRHREVAMALAEER
jgi:hypothetical protein